jgi:hypothetical protein
LLASAGERSPPPADKSVSAAATPPSKLATSSSILSTLRFCRSRWPTHQCKLGKTLYAAPPNDGYDAIRDIGRRRLAATTSSVATG